MKIEVSFSATITDETDCTPNKIHSEEEIKAGIEAALTEIISSRGTVQLSNLVILKTDIF